MPTTCWKLRLKEEAEGIPTAWAMDSTGSFVLARRMQAWYMRVEMTNCRGAESMQARKRRRKWV